MAQKKKTTRKSAGKTTTRKTSRGSRQPLQKINEKAHEVQEVIQDKVQLHTGLRRLSKYAIFAISILIAALISETIENFTAGFVDPATYTAVIIRMLVILAVYVPLFSFLEEYINQAANKYISLSKNAVRSSRQGLVIGFLVALFILFLLFAYLVHGLNFFADAWKFLSTR